MDMLYSNCDISFDNGPFFSFLFKHSIPNVFDSIACCALLCCESSCLSLGRLYESQK